MCEKEKVGRGLHDIVPFFFINLHAPSRSLCTFSSYASASFLSDPLYFSRLFTSPFEIRDPSHGASNFGGYSVNIEEADYARHGLNSQMNADDARPLSTTSTTTFSIVTLDDVLFADFKHRCPSLVKVQIHVDTLF